MQTGKVIEIICMDKAIDLSIAMVRVRVRVRSLWIYGYTQ
jgi:hypothetical protein